MSEIVSPSNALRPDSISNSTAPKAQTSVRRSTTLPRACSGDMYAAVPITTPARVAAAVIVGECVASGEDRSTVIAFARPKSRTLTLPSGRSLTLAGFRSRWTIPFSCAASSASAIWRAMPSASSIGMRPARDALGERLALDELQDEGLRAAGLLEAVDVRNVRMVERGEHLRLALEARQPLRVRGEDAPAGP